ncbi:hypothetical protein L596_001014 [Steinernema carpocapsae]|uniref:Uncharacterized protein n=1 Tax=Steinernema carpocapsae TaxID=34508 RepID=A0A4U8UK22_STECR|nr:hypothetical protein L596_001014 [Steinernema carpocapsae]
MPICSNVTKCAILKSPNWPKSTQAQQKSQLFSSFSTYSVLVKEILLHVTFLLQERFKNTALKTTTMFEKLTKK